MTDAMTFKERLHADLTAAMKSRDELRKRVLRGILTEISFAETAEGRTGPLSDDEVQAIILRLAKQRQESIELARQGGREDIAEGEAAELGVLETYLPARLSREEIEEEARKVIAEVGAEGPRDMGKVMKPLLDRLGDQADGKLVSEVVKALLSAASG